MNLSSVTICSPRLNLSHDCDIIDFCPSVTLIFRNFFASIRCRTAMASGSFSIFPSEIYDMVIFNLFLDQSAATTSSTYHAFSNRNLLSCSLVCRAWLRTCRYHHCRKINIYYSNARGLSALLRPGNCTFSPFVRHLEINWTRTVERDPEGRSTRDELMEAISDACTSFSLDTLYLAGELTMGWTAWSSIYPKTQVDLLSLCGLSDFSCNMMNFESSDTLIGILRSFPRLCRVRFKSVTVYHNKSPPSEATAYLLPNLDTLEISNSTTKTILAAFKPVSALSTLRLQGLKIGDIPHVGDIMRASEQSLMTIGLRIRPPGQDETIGVFLLPHYLQILILDSGAILRTVNLSRHTKLRSIELSVYESDQAPQFILVLLSQVTSSIMDVILNFGDATRIDETFWTTLSNILERTHFMHMRKLLIYGHRADFIRAQLPAYHTRGILQFP